MATTKSATKSKTTAAKAETATIETEVKAAAPKAKKSKAEKTLETIIFDLKNSPSEKARYNAARILGEMGDPEAVESLIEALLDDKNGSVRLYAARALGELGDARPDRARGLWVRLNHLSQCLEGASKLHDHNG